MISLRAILKRPHVFVGQVLGIIARIDKHPLVILGIVQRLASLGVAVHPELLVSPVADPRGVDVVKGAAASVPAGSARDGCAQAAQFGT